MHEIKLKIQIYFLNSLSYTERLWKRKSPNINHKDIGTIEIREYQATSELDWISAVTRLRMECTKGLISCCGMASHSSLSASCI